MKTLTFILFTMISSIVYAQVPVFGSFGDQPDQVTALYKKDTNLYIGANTTVDEDRVKLYNGHVLNTDGYGLANTTGMQITSIGRINGDSLFAFETNGVNQRLIKYDGSSWVATSTSYSVQLLPTADNELSLGGTVFGTQNLPRVYPAGGSPIQWGSSIGSLSLITDFTYHNGNMYACKGGSTPTTCIYRTNGSEASWLTSNITLNSSNFNVHEIESCGLNKLFFVTSNGVIDTLFVWDEIQLTGILAPSGESWGVINDLEFHDGKLFVAGSKLRSVNITTLESQTLSTSNGQINVLESYGDTLALGGTFLDIDGDTLLKNLAYMTYLYAPVANLSVSAPIFCAGDTTVVLNESTGHIDSTVLTVNGILHESDTVVFGAAGTYVIVLTAYNLAGSTSDTNIVVVNSNPEPSISANGATTFCQGEPAVTLCADLGYSVYTWSNSSSSECITVAESGTNNYTCTVIDSNGCVGTSNNITVIVNPIPVPVITLGGNGDLSSDYLTGNEWTVDLNFISNDQIITPNINGEYILTVTLNGCVGSDTLLIDDLGLSDLEIAQYVTINNGQMTLSSEWALYDAAGRLLSNGGPGTFDMPAGVFVLVTDKFAKKYFYNN